MLFLVAYAIDTIFRESDTAVIDEILDCLFIFVESCVPTLEFEEYYLPQRSLRESVEYDIVASFPDEYHILRGIWEVRESREDFLIDFTEYRISRSLCCLFSHSLVFVEREESHDKNPDNESEQSTENERENIQFLYFIYFLSILYTISIVQKIKQILFSLFPLHSQL